MGIETQRRTNEAFRKAGKPIPYPHLEPVPEVKEEVVEEVKEVKPKKRGKK